MADSNQSEGGRRGGPRVGKGRGGAGKGEMPLVGDSGSAGGGVEGRGERQGGNLGLGCPGSSLIHFVHSTSVN